MDVCDERPRRPKIRGVRRGVLKMSQCKRCDDRPCRKRDPGQPARIEGRDTAREIAGFICQIGEILEDQKA